MPFIHPMKVLVADRIPGIITALNELNPSFEAVIGTPLAYEIDAVVSPANTLGIMSAGFDADLRRYFGTAVENKVRKSLDKNELGVGQSRAFETPNHDIKWLIVSPTVSLVNGFTNDVTVAYSAANSAVKVAYEAGARYIGMTGLGTGAGKLPVRAAARQQFKGIEDALDDIQDALDGIM